MDCPEFTALEALLSRFNIFRVLRAAQHEIRHSNMLAWLLTPDESHGLGDRFLRRWLMCVVHNTDEDMKRRLELPSPIEIDALDIESVEVARERENIDLLIIVCAMDGASWTICIENNESAQHSNQLRRYQDIVERRYAGAAHRLFLFLTKYDEEPKDDGFVRSSYDVIESVLRTFLEERKNSIGAEPTLLMTQYLELLAEDFVEESKAAQLARKIYRSHREAIDFILEIRNDPISEATAVMKEILATQAEQFGTTMEDGQNKGIVRFLPKEWDLPQNGGGTAWGLNSRILLCEVNFWPKKAELQIVMGGAPDAWADRVWAPPFDKRDRKKRPAQYVKPFKAKSDIALETIPDADPEEVKIMLAEWISQELKSERFREAVKVMRDLLQGLPEPNP